MGSRRPASARAAPSPRRRGVPPRAGPARGPFRLRGDREAARRRVYGVALQDRARHETAEDVAQEAFVRAWRVARSASSWGARSGPGSAASPRTSRSTTCARLGQREQGLPEGYQEQAGRGRGPARDRPGRRGDDAFWTRPSAELPVEQRAVLVLRVFEEHVVRRDRASARAQPGHGDEPAVPRARTPGAGPHTLPGRGRDPAQGRRAMSGHDRERLSAYLDGELDPRERADVEAHLAACDACSELLARLAAARLGVGAAALPRPRRATSTASPPASWRGSRRHARAGRAGEWRSRRGPGPPQRHCFSPSLTPITLREGHSPGVRLAREAVARGVADRRTPRRRPGRRAGSRREACRREVATAPQTASPTRVRERSRRVGPVREPAPRRGARGV